MLIRIMCLFFLLLLVSTESSYAYIDPGSGSSLFQLLFGIILGSLFALKMFFTKHKNTWRSFLNKIIRKK